MLNVLSARVINGVTLTTLVPDLFYAYTVEDRPDGLAGGMVFLTTNQHGWSFSWECAVETMTYCTGTIYASLPDAVQASRAAGFRPSADHR